MNRIFILLDKLKLELLMIRGLTYTWISQMKLKQHKPAALIYNVYKYIISRRHIRYIRLYKREFIYTKHITLDLRRFRTLAHIFNGLVLAAWLCEKMKVNLKIEGVSDFFENDMIINNPLKLRKSCFKTDNKFILKADMVWFSKMYMRSDYGYKILSQLSIKRELRECADKWFDSHIKRSWTAVHFRGTDVKDIQIEYKSRYRLKMDDYVMYLQGILDNQCDIFVCSDQAQFIDKMHVAFPGRVYARDIQRSYTNRTLHIDPKYTGIHQKKDAIIDILILAKADLVYTTGSGFVDTARLLNPSIKIVSLDERWLTKSFSFGRNSPNGAPIPRKDLFKHLVRHYKQDGIG